MKPLSEITLNLGSPHEVQRAIVQMREELATLRPDQLAAVPIQDHLARLEQSTMESLGFLADHIGAILVEVALHAKTLSHQLGEEWSEEEKASAVTEAMTEGAALKLALQFRYLAAAYATFEKALSKSKLIVPGVVT